jgi:hypothetical protein
MMMEQQMDFNEEETLLQYHGRWLGVILDRTPKCHPEMAGEGIEYNWGVPRDSTANCLLSRRYQKSYFVSRLKRASVGL